LTTPSDARDPRGAQFLGSFFLELTMRMLISWPFDETGLLVGEETYSTVIAVRPLADSEIPAYLPAALAG
jgi:hypothetical protein